MLIRSFKQVWFHANSSFPLNL